MPGFDSPIGSRNFQSQPLREVEVPDASGPYSSHPHMEDPRDFNSKFDNQQSFHSHHHHHAPEPPLEVQSIKYREQPNKLSDGAKRRIEMLLGMSQTTREVKIDSNVFILRSLKSKEMRDALASAFEFDGTIQAPYEIRKQILSRSLTHVAGVEINQFLGSSTIESKFLFIDELDESLLNRLYDEYLILSKDAKDKYSVNTESEAKEVVEDIKKA